MRVGKGVVRDKCTAAAEAIPSTICAKDMYQPSKRETANAHPSHRIRYASGLVLRDSFRFFTAVVNSLIVAVLFPPNLLYSQPENIKMMEERNMNQSTTSTRTDWLIFLVSTMAMILMLKFQPEFFWVFLPFSGTYLAKALKAI